MTISEKVKKYWKTFREECDLMLEDELSKAVAIEQIPMVDAVLEAFDTIEALQQENEQLQGRNTTYVNENANQAKEIERLQDENISIKNWNACEAEQFSELLESDKRRIELEEEVEQLQTQTAQYRETLEQARVALKSVSYRSGLGSDEDGIREALAAIDKVIGGKEDV